MHENRGVSTATDNTVATALTGATVWQKLTASNLTGTGNSFGAQLNHYQYKLAQNSAGQSIPATTWTTVNLNTSVVTEIIGPTLSSNQITLVPAGTYYVEAWQTNFISGSNGTGRIKIFNVTDSADLLVGRNSGNLAANTVWAQVQGRFTLASPKTISLQMWSSGTNAGIAQNNSGQSELYTEVFLWKII